MRELQSILDQVKNEVEVVKDGNTYYLVLNQAGTNDFVFNNKNIKMITELLD